eukprot:g25498.t2
MEPLPALCCRDLKGPWPGPLRHSWRSVWSERRLWGEPRCFLALSISLWTLREVPRALFPSAFATKDGSLDKELASLGVVSRRRPPEQLKGMIRSGRITIDGEVVRNPKQTVPAEATLAIDAVPLHRDPPVLLKFHKPYDVISSMDEKNRRDLSDALPGQRAPWDEEAVQETRVALGGRVSLPHGCIFGWSSSS